ncbi:MAG TPA: enoyl-CoA hydratase-related protein [Gammaproteobacteria bacterium]|nr:enoyl-CoA hydratase-related protein [Gammaproteobacteria bacterium]
MRILFLTHSFNSLAQRLYTELAALGHEVSVELDINDAATVSAVELFRPHLVVAPFLKRAIPEAVWRRLVCLVVHPGIRGDRGPSALDWAILEGEARWGVTVLQAERELDAGPVWAWREFPMRAATKGSLYRFEVTEAAAAAVLEAVERFQAGDFRPQRVDPQDAAIRGRPREPMKQSDRRIDWARDDTATVLRKIRSADGFPGVVDQLAGLGVRLYDAHPDVSLGGEPGALLARRDGAVCRATTDGAVWIGRLRLAQGRSLKLPATTVLGAAAAALPESASCDELPVDGLTFNEIRYEERDRVGYLHFDFHNGAMGTDQCRRLLAALRQARARPTRVIVLLGGRDFWSNGLHLNLIEAAASPADASWENINAMDDLAEAVVGTSEQLTISALGGNAGAGGAFLALAADFVYARDGVILNPHYKNMGNLYGSELWTYLLPRRVGPTGVAAVMAHRLPLAAREALAMGVVDEVGPGDPAAFRDFVASRAAGLAAGTDFDARLAAKRLRREADEAVKPLAAHRAEELERMKLNFYGFDPSYHVARYRFVHRTPHAWTPLYLATHRRLGWQVPQGREVPSPACPQRSSARRD